jgi:hypothetical protein
LRSLKNQSEAKELKQNKSSLCYCKKKIMSLSQWPRTLQFVAVRVTCVEIFLSYFLNIYSNNNKTCTKGQEFGYINICAQDRESERVWESERE